VRGGLLAGEREDLVGSGQLGEEQLQQGVRKDGDVGVWHETYQVRAGAYESTYLHMHVFGLEAAGQSS
jgi:Domain of unknown function (DUF4188)